MMLKEESKKQLITRATQYGVDPVEQELREPLKEVSADAGYSQDTVIKKT